MSKPVILFDNGELKGLSGTSPNQVLVWDDTTKEWKAGTATGTGSVTSVDVSGGTTGLTFSGGPITTSGTITLAGTLNVVNGGTGLSAVTTAGNLLYVSDPNVISEGTLSNLDWTAVVAPGDIDLRTAPGGVAYFSAGDGANLSVDSGGEIDIFGGHGSSGGSAFIYGGYSYDTGINGAGSVEIYGGDVVDTGNAASAPGNIVIQSGNQYVAGATAPSGNVVIDTGYSPAGGGNITIGDTLANSVTIGRSGKTVAIGGSLTIGSALGAAYGGTGLGAPAAGDAGKVLAATSSGTYELVPQSGGGGGGTVTSVATGTGLTGGPITTTGTISLAALFPDPSGTKGSSTASAVVTVDEYGRVTSLSEQAISGLAASVISSGQISPAQGGTGLDTSGATDGQLLIGQSTGSFALHSMSQDVAMDKDGNVTVQGLQTRAVSNAAPSAGQTLVWSTSGSGSWVPGSQASGGSGGGGVLYYFNAGTAVSATNGIPAGTYQLGRAAEGASHSITLTNVATGGWTRVGGFVSDDSDPSLTSIPAGIWDFNIWASSTANPNNMFFRLTFYAYDGSTNPESGPSLGTSVSSYLYDPSQATQYTTSFSLAQTAFTGKRIYIKLEARSSAASKDVTFDFGDGEASHVHTTVPSVTGSGFVKVLNDVIVGTGQTINLSSSTDVGSSVLGLSNGGTNANLTATQGGIAYGTGSALAVSNAGTAGQYLKSNGTSAPTWGDIATSSYDLRGAFVGNPATNAVVDRFVSTRAFTVSTTTTKHKFYCVTPPATGQTVVVTVKKTPVSGSGAVTLFTATFRDAATNPVSGNGLYPASISAVSNSSVAETDLITVEVGTTNAAFQTFSWTIFATA